MNEAGDRVILEVCAGDVGSAIRAEACGADRVELCENLAGGGTTPSHGAIALARERLRIPLQVIVRPRPGSHVHGPDELEVMRRDLRHLRSLGVDGIVLGLLDRDGGVDRTACAELIELARPASVTFHHAFDETRDPLTALDDLIALGVDRLLTSGHAPTALAGAREIADLVRRAAGRIEIMAGGRIAAPSIRSLVASTGVREVHVGSAAWEQNGERGVVSRAALAAVVEEVRGSRRPGDRERNACR